jgi:hypothetical protein
MDEPSDEEDFYRPRTSPRTAIPERAVSRTGRGTPPDDWNQSPAPASSRTGRYGPGGADLESLGNGPGPRAPSYGSTGPGTTGAADAGFGARRRDKEDGRRGSRPSATSAAEDMPRSGRRPGSGPMQPPAGAPLGSRGAVPQGSPIAGASAYGSRPGLGQEPGLGNRPGPQGSAPRSNQAPLGRSGSPRPAGPAMSDAEFRPLRPDAGPSGPGADRPVSRGEAHSQGSGSESGPSRSSSAAPSASPGRDNSSRFDD